MLLLMGRWDALGTQIVSVAVERLTGQQLLALADDEGGEDVSLFHAREG